MYKYKLLVIDDEQKTLDLFQDYFGKRQFEVETANNGTEGLDKLLTGKFDAAIVDLRMPGLDGMQVIEQAMEYQVPTSFIVLTAHGELPDAIKAINHDVEGWFAKGNLNMKDIYQRTLALCSGYYGKLQEISKSIVDEQSA
jgi:DNA-binding response OmpR family regulator